MKATLIITGEVDELQEVLSAIQTPTQPENASEFFNNAAEGGQKFLKLLADRGELTLPDALQYWNEWRSLGGITSGLHRLALKMGTTLPYTSHWERVRGDWVRVWKMSQENADIIKDIPTFREWWTSDDQNE